MADDDDDDNDDDDDDVDVKLGEHLMKWLFQPRWRPVTTVPYVLYARRSSGAHATCSGAAPTSTSFQVSNDEYRTQSHHYIDQAYVLYTVGYVPIKVTSNYKSV